MIAPENCKLHTMEQRSEEWFEIKKGRSSASEVGAWLTKDDARSKSAFEKAICKKIAESRNLELAPMFESWAMTRGTALEEEAVECFTKEMGVEVKEVGFIESLIFQAGCSPDGLLYKCPFGFEGKAPVPDTHIRYLMHPEELRKTYSWQVEFSLAITGFEGWFLQSYCPGLPPVRHLFERSEITESIVKGLERFTKVYSETQDKIRELEENWRNSKPELVNF